MHKLGFREGLIFLNISHSLFRPATAFRSSQKTSSYLFPNLFPLFPCPVSSSCTIFLSVRNGLGARAAPRGNCQEDWTGPDDNFYSVPSWDILGLQG